MTSMIGSVMTKRVTVVVVFFFWGGGICSKNAGLQGITLSGHHMIKGFGPFELSTCDPGPKVRNLWASSLSKKLS